MSPFKIYRLLRQEINRAMAYQTFRVEITRDETRDGGPVGIEITAYIDRMPETNERLR